MFQKCKQIYTKHNIRCNMIHFMTLNMRCNLVFFLTVEDRSSSKSFALWKLLDGFLHSFLFYLCSLNAFHFFFSTKNHLGPKEGVLDFPESILE